VPGHGEDPLQRRSGSSPGIDFLGFPFEAKTNPYPLETIGASSAGEQLPDLAFGVNLDRN
jgi:hypothetical protein